LIAICDPRRGTIEQLTELTGWQPHTVRGTISGALRKRLKLNVKCVAGVPHRRGSSVNDTASALAELARWTAHWQALGGRFECQRS